MKSATKFFLLTAVVVMFSSFFQSCSGDNNSSENNDKGQVDTMANEDTAKKKVGEVDYAVPTPNQLFEVIIKVDTELDPKLVNDPKKSSDYVTEKSKALNFGVYTADLAYLSSFGSSSEALNYFETIQKIGDGLGISAAFDKALINRVEKNKANSDSIFIISNQTYFDTYAFLEENQKGAVLSMIIAGGWVESMYVITHLVGDYSKDHPLMQDIVDQRVVLEQILGFMQTYNSNKNVQSVNTDLIAVMGAFNQMAKKKSETKVKKEGGVIKMSGGGAYEMTPAAFEALKSEISALRNNIIK